MQQAVGTHRAARRGRRCHQCSARLAAAGLPGRGAVVPCGKGHASATTAVAGPHCGPRSTVAPSLGPAWWERGKGKWERTKCGSG
eukprot:362589-Chlamydomonas_euryale.AAC.5